MEIKVNDLSCIALEKRPLIDELTIVKSFVSKRDMPQLRRMCNSIENEQRTGGRLSKIDLSCCRLRSDLSSYYAESASLDSTAFKECVTLKHIVLPSYVSLSYCDGGFFSGCKNLEKIEIKEYNVNKPSSTTQTDDESLYSNDGVLFCRKDATRYDAERTWLVKYPAAKGVEYRIPDRVTNIANFAFEDCCLMTIVMPHVAPNCEERAFHGVDISNITLVVPKGTHDNYWIHPFWGNFNIQEAE